MIIDYTEDLLVTRGFDRIQTRARDVSFFAKGIQNQTVDSVKLCMVVRNLGQARVTGEQLSGMAQELERNLLLKGFREIDVMCMVFTDHPDQELELVDYGIHFWVIDVKRNKLMVYENQPDNYEAMRYGMEYTLRGPTVKRGKISWSRYYGLPIATIILVMVNVIIFFIMDQTGDVYNSGFMLQWGADNWQLVFEQHEYYRLFTSMFLHFGFQHMAYNMLMLVVAGVQVEKEAGTGKFFMIYLVSGVAASLVSCIHYMILGMVTISAGASGAIFGIMGAMPALAFREKSLSMQAQGRRMVLILVLIVIDGYTSEGVDFFAHLGGLVFGFLITMLLTIRPAGKKAVNF